MNSSVVSVTTITASSQRVASWGTESGGLCMSSLPAVFMRGAEGNYLGGVAGKKTYSAIFKTVTIGNALHEDPIYNSYLHYAL